MSFHEHWYGVTYTFTCPQCHRISEEKAAVNSPTSDLVQLQQSINRHCPVCQECAASAVVGTEVTVLLVVATPQSLLENGYLAVPGIN